ncbi:MAG: flagellar hook protein FlgE [bacterium]|nr:MAG: flagellar hook protein FlgE [bacterium]
MGLNSAMYSGVSGILTMGNAMNVIGDNIANVNTVGFKSSRAVFSDLLASSLSSGTGVVQFGRGTFMNNVSLNFTQGSFETTGNGTDMGIQGSGFFVVRDEQNNANYYTRAGQFVLDNQGRMVNPQGYIAQGYQVTSSSGGTINTTGALTDINLGGIQSVPNATTSFRMGLNLNASASAGTTFSTSFDVYNVIGERITLTYSFTASATAAQTWDYVISASSGAVTTGSTGTIQFNNLGALILPTADQAITIGNFGSGAADLSVVWDLYNAAGASYSEVTGYSSPSSTFAITQDGYSTGTLRGLSVDQDGVITGLFSNGQTQSLFQIVLADFASPWGLSREGGSLYAESRQSGQPLLGAPGSAGLGTVLGSSLELSNVDLASEFIAMIQNQRGFQANSRVITTVDDMMAEVVNLKR